MNFIEKILREDEQEKRKAGRGAAARVNKKGIKRVGVVFPSEYIDRRRNPQYRASRCICYTL